MGGNEWKYLGMKRTDGDATKGWEAFSFEIPDGATEVACKIRMSGSTKDLGQGCDPGNPDATSMTFGYSNAGTIPLVALSREEVSGDEGRFFLCGQNIRDIKVTIQYKDRLLYVLSVSYEPPVEYYQYANLWHKTNGTNNMKVINNQNYMKVWYR